MAWRVQIDDEIYKDDGGSSSGSSIPEYTSDPVSPSPEDAWVLRSGSSTGGGSPIGMLLALTTAGAGSYTYEFSYYTNEGTIVRNTLS